MKGNIDNWKCQDCENEEVHICPLDELEDIETVNELNNERDDNEQYYDIVLDTFLQKKKIIERENMILLKNKL